MAQTTTDGARVGARSPSPRIVDVLTWMMGLGLGAVIGMDIMAESAKSLHAAGGYLTAGGRMTSMIGTYLLMLALVFIARLPVIERTCGQERLIAWHRKVAPWMITLLLVHAVLITLGYAQAAHTGALHELWTMITTMGGMLTATVSLALLIVASVTSVRIARKRMSYETWWIVHLYSYLAVALGFSHQITAGAVIAGHPLTQVFWIALWLTTAGMVLLHRVVVPIIRSVRHNLRVVSIYEAAPGVTHIVCSGRNLDQLPVSGGQFLQWRFLKSGI